MKKKVPEKPKESSSAGHDKVSRVPCAQGKGLASRLLALEVLIKVEKEGAFANLALAAGFKRKSLSEKDRSFVTALVQGVLRHRSAIDERIARLSTQPLAKMPTSLRNILRLGLFQLEQMCDMPQAAVVDTCNELARATGHVGLVKFVNGVLRAYVRRKQAFLVEVVDIADAKQLATFHSMPLWLVERWLAIWGPEETKALLEYCQTIPALTLRTCELAITPEGLKGLLESQGMQVRQGRLVDSCLIVEDRGTFKGPVEKLPGFAEGLFIVQDESAAFISKVVSPEPGQLVVDLCAAPGGKSLHLAELMQGKGRVIAVDSHAGRLNLLRKSRCRLGLTNIETVVADSRSFMADCLADRILVDAPCTGTGVINRRSDLRLKRKPSDLPQLVGIQRELMLHAATLVKPGGILVYATCSIEPEENEQNLDWFLNSCRNFVGESLEPYISAELLSEWSRRIGKLELDKGRLQIVPCRHKLSGFFVCRLRRVV
ncbi:MAG: 16S rRNA (cytosine(967)-C(5))-methyltransferase RsmB [Candidatus Melainabacteria bacterium]|nr:16S rRNA (cytosine(967)-C(5))-methyltransferase RsmB [Candidatus Melainabacteria bacterium]